MGDESGPVNALDPLTDFHKRCGWARDRLLSDPELSALIRLRPRAGEVRHLLSVPGEGDPKEPNEDLVDAVVKCVVPDLHDNARLVENVLDVIMGDGEPVLRHPPRAHLEPLFPVPGPVELLVEIDPDGERAWGPGFVPLWRDGVDLLAALLPAQHRDRHLRRLRSTLRASLIKALPADSRQTKRGSIQLTFDVYDALERAELGPFQRACAAMRIGEVLGYEAGPDAKPSAASNARYELLRKRLRRRRRRDGKAPSKTS